MNEKSYSQNIEIIGAVPHLKQFQPELSHWRDGLVVRSPNWLGDAVMTLPSMMQLRKIIPANCGLFVVCPQGLEPFFSSLAMVDVVMPLSKTHRNWSRLEIRKLKALLPGIGVLYNNSLRDAIMFKLAAVPRLFGAAARGRSILLTRSYRYPKRIKEQLNNFHHAAKYLSLAYALGAPEWDGSLPEFNIAREPEIIDRLLLKLTGTDRLMVLAAGAAYGKAKRWPVEYFKEVSRYWINDGGAVITLGTAAEKQIGDAIVENLPGDRAYNLAGQTDLPELMLLLDRAEICVANDSGIMHLSAAMDRPGIAVFGSTDPSATSPISGKWQILFEKQECAPCFKRECPQDNYLCMKSITPDRVIEAIKNIKK